MLPPSASLPYWALDGPRTTSIELSDPGSMRSRNVFTPPRCAPFE
jgi:hypothetical protein